PSEQRGMKQHDCDRLCSKYRRLGYRAAYSVARDKRDAEDALQSLFLKLIDQGFSEDSVRDPAGYLYRAAANEARQMYRARERRTRNHTDGDVEVVQDPQNDRSRCGRRARSQENPGHAVLRRSEERRVGKEGRP